MKPGRIAAVIVGVLLLLPALGLLAAGATLTVAYVVEREDDGYFDVTLDRLSTATAAITTGEVDLNADPGPPEWLLDFVDFTVRIQGIGVTADADIFLGIGPQADVDAYLDGVAREEIKEVESDRDVRYRTVPGRDSAAPPAEQPFWVASAGGAGAQTLTWDFREGSWTAVLMNPDGSPGLFADVTVGIRSGALLPVGLTMLGLGLVLAAIAVTLIVVAARGHAAEAKEPAAVPAEPPRPGPVRLEAELDEPLSHWLWLVKWFLAIPHFVVLFFLWIAFLVLTVIAGFAILFTGRYPRGIFDFNVGVIRWTWRVTYYAGTGGLGTDRYPPFTTDPVDDYPASLEIEYPAELSRGLVLVKWWLLAIPHYLILAVLVGAGWFDAPIGLLTVLVIVAAVALLFTGRYLPGLFALIIGLNRWAFRVLAYAALMTDRYPPFRLDQGGREPLPEAQEPPEALEEVPT